MLLSMEMGFVKVLLSHKIFILLTFLLVFSQMILLKPIVGQGLMNEDYVGLFNNRVYLDKFTTDPIYMWRMIGLHDAAHDFYIHFLDVFFGENYNMYLFTSILLKIIATLLIYPLIFVITQNKLLAFLGTLVYGISYPSAGALSLYVVGNEYLGLAFLNLFLLFYFLFLKQPKLKFLFLSSLIMAASFLASPIRVFPVFVMIPFIEFVILIKNKFHNFNKTLLRLGVIFFPIIFIFLLTLDNLGSGAYSLAGLPDFLRLITDGNWFLTLYPLWGFGYTYLPVYYFPVFGKLEITSFSAYITSIIQTPFILFSLISIFLSFLSKNKLRFFLVFTILNTTLDVLLFFIFTHHFGIPTNLLQEYSGPAFYAGLYASILGLSIISLAITFGLEWYLTGRRDKLLFLIFISPFLSILLIASQWIFTRQYYMYQEGIHRYFVLPTIFSSLFLAGLLTLIYQRSNQKYRIFMILLIAFLTFQIFTVSNIEISQLFNGKKGSGKELTVQKSMQEQTMNFIPKSRLNDDILLYVKFKSDKLGDANQWEETFDWRNLSFWMPIKKSYVMNKSIDGCVAVTWDIEDLRDMAKIIDGKKGFLYNSGGNKEMRCFRDTKGYSLYDKFVSIDNLYAFSIDGPKVNNISEEVKNSLIFIHEKL